MMGTAAPGGGGPAGRRHQKPSRWFALPSRCQRIASPTSVTPALTQPCHIQIGIQLGPALLAAKGAAGRVEQAHRVQAGIGGAAASAQVLLRRWRGGKKGMQRGMRAAARQPPPAPAWWHQRALRPALPPAHAHAAEWSQHAPPRPLHAPCGGAGPRACGAGAGAASRAARGRPRTCARRAAGRQADQQRRAAAATHSPCITRRLSPSFPTARSQSAQAADAPPGVGLLAHARLHLWVVWLLHVGAPHLDFGHLCGQAVQQERVQRIRAVAGAGVQRPHPQRHTSRAARGPKLQRRRPRASSKFGTGTCTRPASRWSSGAPEASRPSACR